MLVRDDHVQDRAGETQPLERRELRSGAPGGGGAGVVEDTAHPATLERLAGGGAPLPRHRGAGVRSHARRRQARRLAAAGGDGDGGR